MSIRTAPTACGSAAPDSMICNGAGNFSGWWHRYWRYEAYSTQLAPTAGAMGYGVPAAVAAARRFPHRTVVALAGDGDFLMNGQELATAVQHGCEMIVLVIDNSAYGTIRMHQEMHYPDRVSGTLIKNPDFVAIAQGYGMHAERIDRTAEFAAAFNRAMASSTGGLLELCVDIEGLTPRATMTELRGG